MKTIFSSRGLGIKDLDYALPEIGNLIRSDNAGNFINLVLDIRMKRVKGQQHPPIGPVVDMDVHEIHSVRYAKTDGPGKVILLKGSRIRPFIWENSSWTVVEQYVPYDNSIEKQEHLNFLVGKELYWKDPNESEDGDED